ncbi:MAG: hypothetical protein QOF56_1873 [Acidobacteriaceae bacterium]|nr:hypothetical protein [Acidobacteriaceae bacterium]
MKKFVTMLFGLVGFVLPLTVIDASAAWAQTQKSAQSTIKLQSLNIKPGLWESTRTIKRTGEIPIPTELLNRLTPEQRARMEERMKANSGGHTSAETEKHCVTREDLERDRLKIAEAKECTTTVVNSTSTNLKGRIVCETAGMHVTGMLELVAADPEHVNGSYHSTMDGNDHTMNFEGTWTSKWLGSSCGDVK